MSSEWPWQTYITVVEEQKDVKEVADGPPVGTALARSGGSTDALKRSLHLLSEVRILVKKGIPS
jgi:hypothetical protein